MRKTVSEWYIKELDKLGFKIRGVIHVGAHFAPESDHYESRGVKHQVWIEPQPGIYQRMLTFLPKRPEVHSFMVACGDTKETATFHVVSGFSGEASSLMPLKRHLEIHPNCKETGQIQVPVMPLDDLLEEKGVDAANFNLLVNDTQGYELRVLKGAVKTLKHVEFAVVEVGKIELYAGSPLLEEVDAWMKGEGFHQKAAGWRGKGQLYGDVLYGR